jgi:hypothetical protein
MYLSDPPPKPAGNKIVIFLFLGGVVILVAAMIILYMRRATPEPPPPKKEMASAKYIVPAAPLISDQAEKPLSPEEKAEPENDEPPQKANRRPRSEKLGTIDPEVVNKFMNARFGQVKLCYERSLKKNAFLEGKVDLKIDVSSKGTVTSVSINEDTVGDREMLGCVKRTIGSWNFPEPENGRVIIAKTFNFKKKS